MVLDRPELVIIALFSAPTKSLLSVIFFVLLIESLCHSCWKCFLRVGGLLKNELKPKFKYKHIYTHNFAYGFRRFTDQFMNP